jgi:hypothetical protein
MLNGIPRLCIPKTPKGVEKSRVLRFAAVVSPACMNSCVGSSRWLPADSAVERQELENLALRHQLQVLRRQRPGRPRLFAIDRLLWIWLYRIWPRCLDAMVLVKPATVVQWQRQGFRLFWRWRSKSGRPSVDSEIRALIRQMSRANPLWGAVAAENSESAENSRVLRFATVVSLAWIRLCVRSFRLLPTDCAAGRRWNLRTSLFVISCMFFAASGQVGPCPFSILDPQQIETTNKSERNKY